MPATDLPTLRTPDATCVERRHIDLVYSTARRLVGDADVADDITQAVFLVLARKQSSVTPPTLSGWLVNATRLVSLEALRRRRTDRRLDQAAARMRGEATTGDDLTAEQIAPLLDEALCKLAEPDRSAVVLRFLEGQSFADVANVIGGKSDAARKRVDRALEKLRKLLMARGIAPSVAAVTVALAASQSTAAPAGVAAAVGTSASASASMLAGAAMSSGVMAKMTFIVLAITTAAGVGGTVLYSAISRAPATRPAATAPSTAVAKTVGSDFEDGRIRLGGELGGEPEPPPPPPPSRRESTPVQDVYANIFNRLRETQNERLRESVIHRDHISSHQAKAMQRIWLKMEAAVNEVAQRQGLNVVPPANMPDLPANPGDLGVEKVRQHIQQRMIVPMHERMADEVVEKLNRDYLGLAATQPTTAPGE